MDYLWIKDVETIELNGNVHLYYQTNDKCSGEVFAVWTLGKSIDGDLAGKISWGGYDKSSLTLTRSGNHGLVLPKRVTSDDHSGKRLSANQYTIYRIK